MTDGVNISEQFVAEVCRKTFLSLWSYANPRGKNPGTELCDILVVCGPHVLVFSVKHIHLKDSGDPSVDHNRWQRKAIEDSAKQLAGAVRCLNSADCVIAKDGSRGLPLPAKAKRIYHRIAVACGGRREVSISSTDGKNGGFVHVFDERSFFLTIRHLDTIADFVEYLTKKEQFLSRASVVLMGGEENLLASYLNANRSFPDGPDFAIFEGDLWEGVSKRPEFSRKLKADKDSYIWDQLVELFCRDGFAGPNWRGPGMTETEQALRVLAMENRFSRRLLGLSYKEFLQLGKAGKVRARLAVSHSGVVYVFFAYSPNSLPDDRKNELTARCFAALCRFPDATTIVGIDTNIPGEKVTAAYTYDLVLLKRDGPQWPEDIMRSARLARDTLGYFKTPETRHIHEDEYPQRRQRSQQTPATLRREARQG